MGIEQKQPLRDTTNIRHWHKPDPGAIGNNIVEFLHAMGGPCRIEIPGRDPGRCRVLVTLLHGNETSGLKALHYWLSRQLEPAVTIYCYVIAIESALLQPLFTHRQVPGQRDYNRCFKPPFDQDRQGRVCQQLLTELVELGPEMVIDMHNTSGDGPAFAVSTTLDPRYDPIVSLFTDRLIVTDLRLGALMETESEAIPIITIECGGAHEETADRIAREGLYHYFTQHDIHRREKTDWGLDIYRHPMRMEIRHELRIAYAEQPQSRADITCKIDIEHHNFGAVHEDTFLAWIRPDALAGLALLDAAGRNHFQRFYRVEGNKLYPRQPQKLFMITSNPVIALSDCLWYAVPDIP